MARIHQVNRDLAKFAKLIDVGLGLVVEKATHDIHGKIVKRTPVDTGRARASWGVGVGAPHKGPPPAPGKETYGAPPAPPTNLTGDAPVYITSNLVYIEALENGHSGQAPNGMVKIAVAEVVAEIDAIMGNIAAEAERKVA